MEDSENIDVNNIPKRFRRIAQFLKEHDEEQFNKLDDSSKEFFQDVYDNATHPPGPPDINYTSSTSSSIHFKWTNGGPESDSHEIWYLTGASGDESAEDIIANGQFRHGAISPGGTTINSLPSSTKCGIALRSINESGASELSIEFITTKASGGNGGGKLPVKEVGQQVGGGTPSL